MGEHKVRLNSWFDAHVSPGRREGRRAEMQEDGSVDDVLMPAGYAARMATLLCLPARIRLIWFEPALHGFTVWMVVAPI